jgi:hypothetical protein
MVNLSGIFYFTIQMNFIFKYQIICLNQRKYFENKKVKQFGMVESKPIWTPFITNCKILKDVSLKWCKLGNNEGHPFS